MSVILTEVRYELFQYGAETFDLETDPLSEGLRLSDSHQLDRQIQLVDSRGSASYISWIEADDSEDLFHRIGWGSSSFFTTSPPRTWMATDSLIWRPLVGERVTIRHIEPHEQILQVSCGTGQLYCCAYERGEWSRSAIRVSPEPPESARRLTRRCS